MNILGIGPLELIFIIIIMILVLGPQQMVVTAKKAGALIRKIVKSPMWGTIMDTSREIRDIPTRLVREAGLEEEMREIRSSTQSIKDLKNISVTIDPLSISGDSKPHKEAPNSVPLEKPGKEPITDETVSNTPEPTDSNSINPPAPTIDSSSQPEESDTLTRNNNS